MDLLEQGEEGRLHLEGIRGLEIEREGRGPLIVSAELGEGQGETGSRVWQFEGEVVIRDPEERLRLSLPRLEVDEAAGEARATGPVRFEGPGIAGTATELVYGLRGQASRLRLPELDDARGGRLTADEALFLDGVRDVELVGRVRATGAGHEFEASRLRLFRREDHGLERAVAGGGVRGSSTLADGRRARWRSERLEAGWDADGRIVRVLLDGEALVQRGTESLAASTIEAVRPSGSAGSWKLAADATVYLRGELAGGAGLLRADQLRAELDASLGLRAAEAAGRVDFEGAQVRGEGERGTFRAMRAAVRSSSSPRPGARRASPAAASASPPSTSAPIPAASGSRPAGGSKPACCRATRRGAARGPRPICSPPTRPCISSRRASRAPSLARDSTSAERHAAGRASATSPPNGSSSSRPRTRWRHRAA